MDKDSSLPFLHRHEFLIRRLHSLSGLIPVGAYMCVHLLTNASVLNGTATFQNAVYQIHSLGRLLPIVEWGFIFIPILFHAILGIVFIAGGMPNTGSYPYKNNIRYTLQRATGMIAFFFIMWHVFHMHGWFHFEGWLSVAHSMGGAEFDPYNAASSASAALSSFVVQALYAIGILACVYHLANGIWTMGITWGVWVSPRAQARANWICLAFGIGLAGVGLSALTGMVNVDQKQALEIENKIYEARVDSGELDPAEAEHKRTSDEEHGGDENRTAAR